jgi:phage repressor protein C with HTH and peptisase S24 domain
MGIELGRVLREARERQDKTQADVGGVVGISRAAVGQWEKGNTEPTTENLIAVCEYLGIDLTEATAGRLLFLSAPPTQSRRIQVAPPRQFPSMRGNTGGSSRIESPMAVERQSMPKDVPVVGIAVGGSEGDFAFNGAVIDYVRRPPGIAHTKDVYALYVVGMSMSPRFEEGELVYVAPSRSPSIGDYVVVQMKPEDAGSEPKAFIKRLVRRTADTLHLEQFNPAGMVKLPTAEVASIHRVIPWDEVLGA